MSNTDQEPAVAMATPDEQRANTDEQPAASGLSSLWWQIAGINVARAGIWATVIGWTLQAIDQGFLAAWMGIGAALGVVPFALALCALVEWVVVAVRDAPDPGAITRVAARRWHRVLDDILMAVVLVAIAIASSATVRQGPVPTWVFVGSVISFVLAALALYGVYEAGRTAFLDYQRARRERQHETSATE